MAKPTKAIVLAATSRAALQAIWEANDPDCVDCEECKRCKTCTRCIRCKDCKNATDCADSRDLTNCTNCNGCTSLKNSSDCTDCHGSDANLSQNLYGCSDCVFVERSFYVQGLRGTDADPIKNRFMQLELTGAEMDILIALPLT